VDVRRHVIKEVITRVLEAEEEWEDGREVPEARAEEDCIVSTTTTSQDRNAKLFCMRHRIALNGILYSKTMI
jgi:hypothetical protein